MSVKFTAGTQFFIGTYAASTFNITGITNANPAVASLSAGHGIVAGELMALKIGWSRLNDRIVRASAVATNDATLEGVNALSTALYAPGSGVGTGQEINAAGWTEITQVLEDWAPSGGDIKWGELQYAATDIGVRYPRGRNPVTLSLPYAFDAALPWLATLRTATDAATALPFRIQYPDGSKVYANAIFSLRDVPSPRDGALVDNIDLSLMARPVSYAS